MRTRRALVVAAALVAAIGRGTAQTPAPRADWPQFRGTPRLTGHLPRRAARCAEGAVALRDRRHDRLVACRGGRRRLRRRRQRRAARDRLRHGQAALEVRQRAPERRVLASRVRRPGLLRRPRRLRPRGECRDRQGRLDLQGRLGDQGLARRHRRARHHRLVRHTPLRARREDGCGAVEVRDQGPGARHADSGGRHRLHRRMRRALPRDSRRPTAGRSSRSRRAPIPGRPRSSRATGPTWGRSTTTSSPST